MTSIPPFRPPLPGTLPPGTSEAAEPQPAADAPASPAQPREAELTAAELLRMAEDKSAAARTGRQPTTKKPPARPQRVPRPTQKGQQVKQEEQPTLRISSKSSGQGTQDDRPPSPTPHRRISEDGLASAEVRPRSEAERRIPSPLARPKVSPTSLLSALQQARPPGSFLHATPPRPAQDGARSDEDGRGGPPPPEDTPASEEERQELAQAVDEARALLSGVVGVHSVRSAFDDEGRPVVVISTERGLTRATLDGLPKQMGRFPAVVELPFELLPLRRQ